MLPVHTVAAGGGSILRCVDGRLLVGTSQGLNTVHADGSAQAWDATDGLNQLSVLSMTPAARGGVWIGIGLGATQQMWMKK